MKQLGKQKSGRVRAYPYSSRWGTVLFGTGAPVLAVARAIVEGCA